MSMTMPFHLMEQSPFIYNRTYSRTTDIHPVRSDSLPDGSPIPPPHHSTVYIDRRCVSAERAKQLERNRIAANKCREKKKLSTARMNLRVNAQSSRNKALKKEVECLREELWSLKNQLFDHALCENQLVDSYLGNCITMQQQETPAESAKARSSSDSFSTSVCSEESIEDVSLDMNEDRCIPEGPGSVLDEEDLFRRFVDL